MKVINTLDPQRSIKNIAAIVIAGHLLLLLWMLWVGEMAKRPSVKALSVRTISATSSSTSSPVNRERPLSNTPKATSSPPPQVATPLVAPKPTPQPVAKAPPVKTVSKAQPVPTASVTKVAPKKPTAVAPATPSPRQQLLADAKSKLAAAAKAGAPASSLPSAAPSAADIPTSLQLPSESSSVIATGIENYRALLTLQLQQQLKLPEYGAVTLTLTLDRNGHISKWTIINATSIRNRSYIESSMPQLQLSPPTSFLSSGEEHTIQLTLTSAV